MKAYTKLSKGSSEISLTEVSIPIIEENELLVKVHAIGVGVHDEYFHPADVEYPYVIGIEGAGTIEQVGKNVSSYKAGERIAFVNSLNKKGGTWAEYTTLPKDSLIIRLPHEMSFNEAAAMPVVGNTILKAFSALDLKPNDSLFIAGGSGAIGTLAIQIAHQKGYKVIASASEKNHEYMKSLGADETVDYHNAGWQEEVKKLLPDGVDAAIAIQPGTARESAVVVKDGGVVIAVSGDQVELGRGITLRQIPHMTDITKELNHLYEKVVQGVLRLTLQEYSFAEGIKVLEKVKTRHERGKSVLLLR